MYRRVVDEIALGREVFDGARGVLAGGDDQGRVAVAPGQLVGYSAYTLWSDDKLVRRSITKNVERNVSFDATSLQIR